MVQFTTAKTDADLQGILDLQQANITKNISEQEAKEQGFVTVIHNLPLLQKMNAPHPHIIAKDGDKVVGYALVMLKSMREEIPFLVSLFREADELLFRAADQLEYKGERVGDTRYFVMGQVCVAKGYRGQGIFAGLYETMAETLRPHFDYIVTDISAKNTRSIRAHQKVGFHTMKTFEESGSEWVIVLMKL